MAAAIQGELVDANQYDQITIEAYASANRDNRKIECARVTEDVSGLS